MPHARIAAAALSVLVALVAHGALAEEYTIEGPPAVGSVPVPPAVPPAGSGLTGPPAVPMTLPTAPPPPIPLPTVGVAGSTIQPGFSTPTASVPVPQVLHPR